MPFVLRRFSTQGVGFETFHGDAIRTGTATRRVSDGGPALSVHASEFALRSTDLSPKLPALLNIIEPSKPPLPQALEPRQPGGHRLFRTSPLHPPVPCTAYRCVDAPTSGTFLARPTEVAPSGVRHAARRSENTDAPLPDSGGTRLFHDGSAPDLLAVQPSEHCSGCTLRRGRADLASSETPSEAWNLPESARDSAVVSK